MSGVYDVNGNEIATGGGSGSFGVDGLAIYNDGTGNEREGVLTYSGRKLYPINQAAQRKLKPKNYNGGLMIALGDSYTAMATSNFADFAASHGLAIDNLGLASSTIAGSSDNVTVGYYPFWNRLDTEIAAFPKSIGGTTYQLSDVKLVTVMGGANDWWTVDPSQGVDRLGDPTSTDKEQLWGAIKYILDKILKTFVNADVIVILQPSNVNGADNNYAMWLKEGIVRDAAEMFGIPTCDCRFEWFSPVSPTDKAAYWQNDNLHLSSAGNTALFEKLEETLNGLPFYRG